MNFITKKIKQLVYSADDEYKKLADDEYVKIEGPADDEYEKIIF